MKLGLKCSVNNRQFYDRLAEKPDVIEFHLNEDDLFGEKLTHLEKKIAICKDEGIHVYLHHPRLYRGRWMNMLSDDVEVRTYFELSSRILAELAKKHDVYVVIHPHYSKSLIEINEENVEEMKVKITHYNKLSGDRILWENATVGMFTFENESFYDDFVKPLNLNLCLDISHAFISFKGDNNKLIAALEQTKEYVQYYHVVDSMGKAHDSLEIGEGLIDWTRVVPYLEDKPMILEVGLSNVNDCTEMIRSYHTLNAIRKNASPTAV